MKLILIVLALLLVVIVILFNSLVAKKNRVKNAFAGIDVQLKKRADLIPNLVGAVKGYMDHEAQTLTTITELRAKMAGGGLDQKELLRSAGQLGAALSKIMVQVENYPDLKASKNFLHLQASLNEVEEQLSAARRAYNASVLELNNAVEMLPTNILASLMKYEVQPYFEAEGADRAPVDVGPGLSG